MPEKESQQLGQVENAIHTNSRPSDLRITDMRLAVVASIYDYPILRHSEMPKVDVHIVASSEKSGGVGEPGTPPIAPAVANAIFAATGKRLYKLPFRLT